MFRVGDVVEWNTHGGSYYKKNRGTIYHVVPSGEMPPPRFQVDTTVARKGESYIVLLEKVSKRQRSDKFRWPHVSQLRKSNAA